MPGLKMKKAQLTVFIIIGVVIIAAVAAFLVFRSVRTGMTATPEIEEAAAVQSFIQSCAEQSARKAVIFNGFEGGYFSNYERSFYPMPKENDLVVSAYLLNSSVSVPSLEEAENALAERFNEQLVYCTDSFTKFEGVEIEESGPLTEVRILNDKIMFSVNYSVKIRKQDKVAELSRFNAEVYAELMTMLDVAHEYMDKQKDFPDSFLVSLAGELAARNGLEFRSTYIDDGVIVAFIKNDSSLGEPYEFWFGLRYGGEE